MAHIVEFSVDGLAGRRGAYSGKLNRDVNVFFGLNGSGKTSLLKILNSAMDNDASTLRNVPFRSATVKVYSVHFHAVFTHRFRKVGKLTTEEKPRRMEEIELRERGFISIEPAREKVTWQISPKGKKTSGGRSHSYLPTSRLWIAEDSRYFSSDVAELPRSEEQLDFLFQGSLERLWQVYMSGILSEIGKAQESGLANILRLILTTGARPPKSKSPTPDLETAYKRAKSFLARRGAAEKALQSLRAFSKLYSANPTLRNVVAYINEVELGIEKAMAPREKLQELISKLFSGNKKVVLTEKSIDVITNNKLRIQLASLSSGEKHVLRILIEALHTGVNSLIIDEPEISMHVDWQKRLVPALRSLNPSCQLILATHSPEVIAPLSDEKIFRI